MNDHEHDHEHNEHNTARRRKYMLFLAAYLLDLAIAFTLGASFVVWMAGLFGYK